MLKAIREYFGGPIPLDPCTTEDNPTDAVRFFTKEQDGLLQDWDSCYVNPPWGKELRPFIEKIAFEASKGTEILFLCSISNRFETAYWHASVLTQYQNAEVIFDKRVQFEKPVYDEDGAVVKWERTKGNNLSSIMFGFNVDVLRFVNAFRVLGCPRVVNNFVSQ